MNGRKKDGPVPVKKFAQRCGLKAFNTPSHLKSLKTWDFPVTDNFDVGVVVSFGYFLVRCCQQYLDFYSFELSHWRSFSVLIHLQHPNMLKNLHHGAINMHPSLLPKVLKETLH